MEQTTHRCRNLTHTSGRLATLDRYRPLDVLIARKLSVIVESARPRVVMKTVVARESSYMGVRGIGTARLCRRVPSGRSEGKET